MTAASVVAGIEQATVLGADLLKALELAAVALGLDKVKLTAAVVANLPTLAPVGADEITDYDAARAAMKEDEGK